MQILRGFSTDPTQPITGPFPSRNGVFFELRGGDVAEPIGFGTNWFKPPYPSHVLRFFCPWRVLPFLSWKLGSFGGYIGFKAYGVDAPEYPLWLCKPEECYSGSVAMCITARLATTL